MRRPDLAVVRFVVAVPLILGLVACGAVEPARSLTVRETRLVALDSLARSHPCSAIHATLVYDSLTWSARHACAVAGRALRLLGASTVHEPFYAPDDTARVVAMSIGRSQGCWGTSWAEGLLNGRMEAMSYQVEMEQPGRERFVEVVIDARTFTGGVWFSAHPRDVWGGSGHVARWPESPDTIADGAPCPE
jgi:hypothetical protein